MNKVFSAFGIDIEEEHGKYFLTYDSGEIVMKLETIEISQEDAVEAQISSQNAYAVILKYQNMRNN